MFLILTIGAVLSLIVGVASGAFPWTQIFSVMGTGITAMYDITVISIVVACIGALVREYGGIQWLIDFVHRRANSKRGAQLGIAGLVAAVDVATANNTVAIVMTGSIAKDISQEYHIDPRRSASLLDIFASVMQGILPLWCAAALRLRRDGGLCRQDHALHVLLLSYGGVCPGLHPLLARPEAEVIPKKKGRRLWVSSQSRRFFTCCMAGPSVRTPTAPRCRDIS